MPEVIEIVPAGAFSAVYDVLKDGQPRGRIGGPAFSLRERATLEAAGREYVARRSKVFGTGLVLETPDGAVVAEAEKVRFWREEYRIQFGGSELFLMQKPWSLKGEFVIRDASGELGNIVRERMFTRRLAVEIATGAAEPPLEVVEFLVWIVLVVRRRQAAAASG